ncbi:hypothetical protein BLOT_003029 [Blomia tropicalis]|nr:hypothetical protein BLOT_003029 [Blomia tropicalis]
MATWIRFSWILISIIQFVHLSTLTEQSTFLNSLIARFQSNGIRGYVLFTENGTSTSISTKIFNNADNNENYSWKMYNSGYMIDNHECNVRNNIYLSFDMTSLMGDLEPVKQNLFNVHLNFVTGEHSFLGKTLVLKGRQSGHMSCAIVLPFENKSTFISTFRGEVQGLVYFLQSGNLFSMISSLHHSSPIEKTSFHDWAILQIPTSIRSEELLHQFNHRSVMNNCQGLNGNYLLRNNESNQVSISSEKSTLNSRSYVNLRNIILPQSRPLFLVLYSDSKVPVSCASIDTIQSKRVVARFDNDPHLVGQVMFSQESPIDPTLVDIELKHNEYAYSYGIDELPTISRHNEEIKQCANINNIIYNPANISPFSVPIEGLGTSDQYAIGDLSGKYGTLLQKQDEKISTVDFNLPLFGKNSIVGRALVFYAPNGTTVGCANLEQPETEMAITFATFDRPIQGQIILKQRKNNCTDDTYVYFEISRSQNANGSLPSSTFEHEWSIREKSVFTDNSWSTPECNDIGEILNPYNKTIDTIYDRDCNPSNMITCRLGDMSRKLSTIDIVPYQVTELGMPNLKKYYFIDSFLPLCGPNSIIGKSIQINMNNRSSEALSCTNLVLLDSEDNQDYN